MSIFDNILPEDVLFQTKDVCILKPEVKKGVLVYHRYNTKYPNIVKEGIKSNHTLLQEGFKQVCQIPHTCIFFRAPYQSPFFGGKELDYSSPQKEIESVFPKEETRLEKDFYNNRIWIRVDPRKTFIFSSEIRDIFFYPKLYQKTYMINNSRKSMLDYWSVLEDNTRQVVSNPNKTGIYNLLTSRVEFRDTYPSHFTFPYNPYLIHKTSEILVEIPHLKPHHFVRL